MQKLRLKMKRKNLTHLLLVFLLLATFKNYFYTPIMVQAIESVDFKLGSAQPGSLSEGGYILSNQEDNSKQIQGKKIRKVPSGPSPIGNRHPPSKP